MRLVEMIDTHPVIRAFSFPARFEDVLARVVRVDCCRSHFACCSKAGTGWSPSPKEKSLLGQTNVQQCVLQGRKLPRLRGQYFALAIRCWSEYLGLVNLVLNQVKYWLDSVGLGARVWSVRWVIPPFLGPFVDPHAGLKVLVWHRWYVVDRVLRRLGSLKVKK